MSDLHCQILTPDGSQFEGDVAFVEAHAVDGRIGVLPRHAPLVTALAEGPLKVRLPDSTEKRWRIEGEGFLQVLDNRVSVVAERLVEA